MPWRLVNEPGPEIDDSDDVEYFRVYDNLSAVMVFKKLQYCRACGKWRFIFVITTWNALCQDCHRSKA